MTYLLGLTGGIATGKSTVADLFKKAGYPVVDADVIARAVVAPGQPALDQIVARFGNGVLLPDGSLDRKALGRLVFNNAEALDALNQIEHPEIRARLQQALTAAKDAGAAIVVGDIPLMYETGWDAYFDGVAVVNLKPALQLSRLMARDHLSQPQAQARIDAQMPLAQKVAQADFVIDNSLGPQMREVQVAQLIAHLTQA